MPAIPAGWTRPLRWTLHALALLTVATMLSGCGGGTGSTPEYRVSGSLTGLAAGDAVVLAINQQPVTLSSNGGFSTGLSLPAGASYDIAVATQPAGQTCLVVNGSGIVGSSNVIDVSVSCSASPGVRYTIGGTLTGLTGTLQLLDNGSDPLTLTANGPFNFAVPLFDQASYDVTVVSQPSGQTCAIGHGAGTVQAADVTSVQVACAASAPPGGTGYTLGGNVTGLTGTLVLAEGAQTTSVSADGSYTFPDTLASGSAYAVTVQSQPASQTCTVVDATGTIGSANVSNVDVSCSANAYSIGGSVSGLAAGPGVALVLRDNGGDSLTLTVDGAFTFASQVASGAGYDVTVASQPSGQTCSVGNGSGTVATADVTSVQVTCRALQTVSFTTPGAASWTVPAGVTSIQVVATGGAGGGDSYAYGQGLGGNGATVTATLAVSPGQVLDLYIGGGGAPGGGSGLPQGTGHYGGGSGGGATNVDAGAADQVIAGGGGGGYADSASGNWSGGSGCASGFAGGSGQDPFGTSDGSTTGAGGAGGVGGAGGTYLGLGEAGASGGNGNGGAGGFGGPQLFGSGGGLGSGSGSGGNGGFDSTSATPVFGAGGGGGYGGGGGGNSVQGGAGAGGSVGPAGSTCTPASNGGTLNGGGNGSVVISY